MADLQTIATAKATQAAFKRVLGVKPSLDIQADHVRIYYPADRLKEAQAAFSNMMEKPPGKIRTELAPVVTPYYIKKGAPIAIGLGLTGFFLGRQ